MGYNLLRPANRYTKIFMKISNCLSQRRKHLIGSILLLSFSLLIIFYIKKIPHDIKHFMTPSLLKTKYTERRKNINAPYKLILYWDSFYGDKDMGLGNGSKIFENCPVSNCFATSNRTMVPVDVFDAIIFHGARYSSSKDGRPERRGIRQKYIFFSTESPYNTYFDEQVNKHFYNWTMTYRRDSDIHTPYGIIQEVQRNYTVPTFGEIKERKRLVAWFVSNCHTLGTKRRIKYTKELSKHISVDIYGRCGHLTCTDRTKCFEMLEKNYKFYLSFENSMCADYVTEKLFNILKYNVVPVVLGYGNYSSIAPPYSVIDVYDFDGPKALAQYLLELQESYEPYIKYFEWKKNFAVANPEEYILCQLCELLNNPLQYNSYSDIRDWFYGSNCVL